MRAFHNDHPCGDCGRVCAGERELTQHRRTEHVKEFILERNEKRKSGDFVCDTCGKTFSDKSVLSSHIKNRHKDIACDHCEEHFQVKTEYHNHLRDQHAVSPVSCHLCDYKTYDEASLKTHVKTHLKRTLSKPPAESTRTCGECGKTFKTSSYIRHVRRVHLKLAKTEEIPCPICSKIFTRKETLSYHLNVHSGAKPYKCFYCEAAYQNKSNRCNHMKKSHPDLYQKQKQATITEESGDQSVTMAFLQ